MKRGSISSAIREMQIKTKTRQCFITTRVAMIKKWKITGVGEYVEKLEPSVIDEIIK